jgi:hypothetical protein
MNRLLSVNDLSALLTNSELVKILATSSSKTTTFKPSPLVTKRFGFAFVLIVDRMPDDNFPDFTT